MPYSVVLAEDFEIFRKGLRLLLENDANFRVVGEACSGPEAIRLVRELHPDILVLDMVLPQLNGIEVTRQVKTLAPQIEVIILSMHDDESYVSSALLSGASGYVLKENSVAELLQAIREVLAGHRYLSRSLSERLIDTYLQAKEGRAEDAFSMLTPREKEILSLVAAGSTSAEIARRLVLSVRTVENHRSHLMHKLELHNTAEVIEYARRHGLN